jgi:hypothetical protein
LSKLLYTIFQQTGQLYTRNKIFLETPSQAQGITYLAI